VRQLEATVPLRHPQHRDVTTGAVQVDAAVHPRALRGHLGFQLEPELGEERDHPREIGDDDPDVVHPAQRHGRAG
jgi:hypothetical protein